MDINTMMTKSKRFKMKIGFKTSGMEYALTLCFCFFNNFFPRVEPIALYNPPNCTLVGGAKNIKVNCSHLGIDFFPNFCEDRSSGFNVRNDSVFSDDIVELDLSNNRIQTLKNSHFHCLKNLKELNLEKNSIILNSLNYHEGVFSPLVSLLRLNLKHNSKLGKLIDNVFAELKNLEELRIDAPTSTVFENRFSELKKFHTLDISGITGYCYLRQITRRTFENLRHIRYLDLSACKIKYIENGSFSILPNLTYLSLSNNKEIGFQGLQNVTNSLQYTNIMSLQMENIRCLLGPDTELCHRHLAPLATTSLKELNLAGNRLNWMETGVLANLPKSLEKLSFANNRISMGYYTFEYRFLYNLRELNLSLQLNPPSIVKRLSENCRENPDLYRCPSNKSASNFSSQSWQIESPAKDIKTKSSITLYLPPKLEIIYLNSSRLFGTLGSFGFSPASLKKIFMRNNIWFKWSGPLHGFENVIELDISRNFCNDISLEFFSDFYSLKKLHIGENYLGKSLSIDYGGCMFKNLYSLEFVNLSSNGIELIHREIFSNSSKLKDVILHSNKLFQWEMKISHMKNLRLLDLSDNRLSTLSKTFLDDLEDLFRTSESDLIINLNNNQLSCSCRNLDFLKWLRKFRSHFKDYIKYTCMEDSSILDKSIDLLNDKCKTYLLWYIIGSTLGTFAISITISFLIYKNRWKIRYLRYIASKKIQGYQRLPCRSDTGEFEFDAYVSYNEEDISFVKHDMVQNLEQQFGLKLVIMHRDMAPCGDHASNIMDYICQSKHMICVVTKGYLESDWQNYELNMARMEGIEARKTLRFVYLILMPDVCQWKYPKAMRDFIRKSYYIEYPDDQLGNIVFWEKLKNEIQRNPMSTSLN